MLTRLQARKLQQATSSKTESVAKSSTKQASVVIRQRSATKPSSNSSRCALSSTSSPTVLHGFTSSGSPTKIETSVLKAQFLEACPDFAPVLAKHEFPVLERRDVFTALLRAVVGQQLSGKAAQSIWNKFRVLLEDNNSNVCRPQEVLNLQIDELRSVGLSQRKAEYVRGIAEYFLEHELSDDSKFDSMSDAQIIEMLTSIRGVGSWTVHILLMFSLQRFDVLPVDDLGIKKGSVKFFKLKAMPKKGAELEQYFTVFSPYRTFAAYFMWRVADTTLAV